jgi:hypothetical protein
MRTRLEKDLLIITNEIKEIIKTHGVFKSSTNSWPWSRRGFRTIQFKVYKAVDSNIGPLPFGEVFEFAISEEKLRIDYLDYIDPDNKVHEIEYCDPHMFDKIRKILDLATSCYDREQVKRRRRNG